MLNSRYLNLEQKKLVGNFYKETLNKICRQLSKALGKSPSCVHCCRLFFSSNSVIVPWSTLGHSQKRHPPLLDVNPSHPDFELREKTNLNFHFTLLYGASKGLIK